MNEILARDFMNLSEEQIWTMPNQDILLKFDNGECITTGIRETIYCYYCWEFHKRYPKLQLLPSHHMGSKLLNPKTHTDLLGNIVVDCYNIYRDQGVYLNMDDVNELIFAITNRIYNVFVEMTERYVKSISVLDFAQIVRHPKVIEVIKKVTDTNGQGEFTINKANDFIEKFITTDPEFRGNGIADPLRYRLITAGSALQCVGLRGNPTDIDSHIFRKSVFSGYARGIRNITDLAEDSRTAAKSLFFQRDPMRKSEYFNRACQLSAATLQNLHMVDCGNKDYYPITIKSKKLLKDMIGIYHYCEALKTERPIRQYDTHLVGKTVKCRLVFSCKHPDRNGVCYRCYGDLSLSIPANTNIGHVAASDVQSRVAQLLLSNKHLDSSANIDAIYLSEYDRGFVTTGAKENGLYFAKGMHKRKLKIVIAEADTQGLDYVKVVATSDQLVPYRLSEIGYIQIMLSDKPEDAHTVCVSCDTRKSYLSRNMLRYVKDKDWTINEQGNYVIDMSDWDMREHFLELPLKHFSTVDYMQSIEGFIKGGITRDGDSIMNYEDPAAALMAFHDLVSVKLDCHVSHLQVIILSTMVQSSEDRDFRLPLPREQGKSAFYNQQMAMRSLSATMAYQNQAMILYSPTSYLCHKRPPHPLDPMLVPS